MYEYIEGKIAELTTTYAVIDCSGVGYFVNISLQTYSEIENATQYKLFVHYIVREDAQILYGFSTKRERELFRLLIGVSGVGGNTARMILSTYATPELQSIIATENAVLLKNVKGLGLKTAQKIIVELSGKMTTLSEPTASQSAVSQNITLHSEAMEAMMALGFAKSAAEKAVKHAISQNEGANVETIIRAALKSL